MDRLDHLINILVSLGVEETMVGQGLASSSGSNPSLQSELDKLFTKYPFLRDDQGYVEFLKRYGGSLHVERPDDDFFLDIFGIDVGIDGSLMHILGPDEGYTNIGDYLVFATFAVPHEEGFYEIVFAWNSGSPPHRIHRQIVDSRQPAGRFRAEDFKPYCDTLMEWLEAVVEHEGRLLD